MPVERPELRESDTETKNESSDPVERGKVYLTYFTRMRDTYDSLYQKLEAIPEPNEKTQKLLSHVNEVYKHLKKHVERIELLLTKDFVFGVERTTASIARNPKREIRRSQEAHLKEYKEATRLLNITHMWIIKGEILTLIESDELDSSFKEIVSAQKRITHFKKIPERKQEKSKPKKSKTSEDAIDQKFPDLAGSHAVNRAVLKTKQDTERVSHPHTRRERIYAYIERVGALVEDARAWRLLREKVIKEFTIDPTDEESVFEIARALHEREKRLAIEEGRGGDVEALSFEEILNRHKEDIRDKHDVQRESLNRWLEYMRQNDAGYPNWFRYLVIRSIGKMGAFDKKKGAYTKRTQKTLAPFPELNAEALGFVFRMLTTGVGDNEFVGDEQKEKRKQLEQLIKKVDFAGLYAFAQIETAHNLNRESLEGEWVLYPQHSDPNELTKALRGKGTGWCTAEGSAGEHLSLGDFYVFFTKGTGGKYTEPRIAIRIKGGVVSEVRGVEGRQELEPILLDKAREKYKTLPGGDRFEKKTSDMKLMTQICKKVERREALTKEELRFLYEIDVSIEGFGYEKDPRIKEVQERRDLKKDLASVFDCHEDQISLTQGEALKGNIVFHYGDIYLGSLTSAEGLTMPEHVGGYVHLGNLTSAEGLTMPEHVGGNVYLWRLTSAEGLTMPEHVGGYVHLGNLTSAEGLTMPEHVGGYVHLGNLTSAEGLTMPEHVGGNVHLGNLTSAEGLTMPEHVGGNVYLWSLTSDEKDKLREKHPQIKIVTPH